MERAMNDIPVEFTHNSVKYFGTFTPVSGAGSTALYHLYVGGFYRGQLWRVSDGWRFASQSGDIDYLEDYFIQQIKKAGS